MLTPDPMQTLVQLLLGAAGGFLGALVTFRTRLALSDQSNATRRLEDDQRFARIERRQRVTLEILADIARSNGADKRFSDGLVRFLAEDREP